MTTPAKILFVTGTDTGVGKTFVAASLARELRSRNIMFDVLKPVETGCRRSEQGELVAEDALKLWEAGWKLRGPESAWCFRYETPVAPLVASREEGRGIDPEALLETIRSRSAECPLLIVEGAGGLLVPITESFTFCDLASRLGAETLLVIGSRLGAINHTLLSLEVLAQRKISIFGYILNHPCLPSPADEWAQKTNRATLRELAAKYSVRHELEVGHVDTRGNAVSEPSGISDLASALIKWVGLITQRGEPGRHAASFLCPSADSLRE